jgi:hypothetical protein
VIVLTPDEYERLDASRRQIGAKNSRIQTLNHELQQAISLLAQIEDVLTDERSVDGHADHRAPCRLQTALLDIIRTRRHPSSTRARHHGTVA